MREPSEIARSVLLEQARALMSLAERVDGPFSQAVELLRQTKGHLVVTGVGKSGLIGRKIAATLSSTGTPAFWMHPTEAFHGDLGSVTEGDAALLISYSGETEELVRLIPALRRQKVTLLAMTGRPQSSLARLADVHLDVSVERETCPHNLAPTTSTTVTLALGDALAVALMTRRGFAPEDFAKFHPGGSLGKALALVEQVMRVKDLPTVGPTTEALTTVRKMTAGLVGSAVVVDADNKVQGIVTDGDVRRVVERLVAAGGQALTAYEVMTPNPLIVSTGVRVVDAKALMERHQIKVLPVVDSTGRLMGLLDWALVA